MQAQHVPTSQIGHLFEERAAQFLDSPIRKLIQRNFHAVRGELDLIYEELRPHGEIELVFVEVRVRREGAFESGLESVTPKKRQRLRLAARRFLLHYMGLAQSIRFDVLSWDGTEWEHCEDAF